MITNEEINMLRKAKATNGFTYVVIATEWLPKLLDEIERLQKELNSDADELTQVVRKQEAEIARLRKVAEYAEHKDGCATCVVGALICDCGLNEARK